MTLKFSLVSYIMFMFTLPTLKKNNIYICLHIYNLQSTSTYDCKYLQSDVFNKKSICDSFSNIVGLTIAFNATRSMVRPKDLGLPRSGDTALCESLGPDFFKSVLGPQKR